MRKKRLGFFSAALALLVIGGLGLMGLLRSPLFDVRDIVVAGAGSRRAFILALSGVRPSESIWQVDPAAVEGRLRTDPRIASATVRLDLPRTVLIRVRWRQPVAFIILGSGLYAVDKSGVLLPPPLGSDLPFITGITAQAKLYSPVPAEALTAALRTWRDLAPAVRDDISEIHCEKGRIRLYTLSGTPIRLGTPIDLRRQLAPLLGIIESLREHPRPVSLIDLSLPGHPLVDLRTSTGTAPSDSRSKPHG